MFFLFYFFADRAFAEKQRYDGWYNNLAHPNWGSAGKSYDLCRYLSSRAEFKVGTIWFSSGFFIVLLNVRTTKNMMVWDQTVDFNN